MAFVWVERRTEHPLVRLEMFRDRVFAAANVVTVLVYADLSVFFLLLVLQLQVVSGWTPLAAGTSLLAAGGFAAALRIGPDARYLADVAPQWCWWGRGSPAPWPR